MKSKLITTLGGIFVFLIVFYSVISWWSGQRIEQSSHDCIEAVNERLAQSGIEALSVKEIQYKRGIFASEAVYALSVAPTSQDAKPVEIRVLSQIDHGPFPLRALLSGQFAPHLAVINSWLIPTPYTQTLFDETKGRPFLAGQSLLDLNGDLHIDWSAVGLDLTVDGTHIAFSGATVKLKVNAQMSDWQTELTLPSLELSQGGVVGSVHGARIFNNKQLNANGSSVATRGATATELIIKQASRPTLVLTDLQSRLVLNETDSLIDGVLSADIAKAQVGDKPLGKLSLLTSFDHFSAEPVKTLAYLYGNVLARSLNRAPDADLITNSDVKAFWQQVQLILKDKPALHINPLSLQDDTHKGTIEVHLAFTPTDLKPSGVGLNANPLGAFHANLNASRPLVIKLLADLRLLGGATENHVDSTAEREVNTALVLAMLTKFIKISGDDISTSLTLDKNIFKLNGIAVSTDGFVAWLDSKAPQGWLKDDVPVAQSEPDDASSKNNFDPEKLIEILTANGRNFSRAKDDQGDQLIQIAPEGTGAAKLEFVFVGCGADPTCEDVVLRAVYGPKQASMQEHVDDWNQAHSLARARINTAQEPVLEMEVSAYGGLSKGAMQSMIDDFFALVKEFALAMNPKAFDPKSMN